MQKFTVPGKPVGYYARGPRPNWVRDNAYRCYQQHVQRCAMLAGIEIPLVATKDQPLIISTIAYFQNGTHPDPENIRKGICDALFYSTNGSKGSADKYCGGSFPPPLYDKKNPRVEVEIVSA